MPITSLWCPCVGMEVPLDHYSSGACTRLPMPIPWIIGIQKETMDDDRHPPMVMSASRLAQCQRASAIMDLLPVPRVDLRRFNSNAHGWAAHAWMRQHTPPSMFAEIGVKGTLFKDTPWELYVEGHFDVVRPRPSSATRMVLLEDYKITNETNQKYMSEVTEKVEWNIQTSTYRRLAPELGITDAAIWQGAAVPRRSSAEPWVQVPTRFLSEEEILAAKPFEGEATVADHIEEFKRLRDELASGVSADVAISEMPLRGEQQWRRKDGSSKCDFCVMGDVCAALARRGARI